MTENATSTIHKLIVITKTILFPCQTAILPSFLTVSALLREESEDDHNAWYAFTRRTINRLTTAKKQPYLEPYQFNSRPIIGDWGVAHPCCGPCT